MKTIFGIVIIVCVAAVTAATAMTYSEKKQPDIDKAETFLDGYGELEEADLPVRSDADLFGLLSKLWPGGSLPQDVPLSTKIQDFLDEEGWPSASISIEQNPGGALVEMEANGFADDSVAGTRIRAVLVEESGIWSVKRIGVLQRCYRSLAPNRWAIGPCP